MKYNRWEWMTMKVMNNDFTRLKFHVYWRIVKKKKKKEKGKRKTKKKKKKIGW